jgi:DNA-directed RNA polymerase specialized sigma24 family protein
MIKTEDQKNISFIHECLRFHGRAVICEPCPVKIKGYDQEFLILIQEKAGSLFKEGLYDAVPDIVADFVQRVIKNIHTFEARWNVEHQRNANFKSWAAKIFDNTRADYFRSRKTVEIKTGDNETVTREDLTEKYKKWWNFLSDDEHSKIDAGAIPEARENESLLKSHREKEFEHLYFSRKSPLPPQEEEHPYYEKKGIVKPENPNDIIESLKCIFPDQIRFLLHDIEMQNDGLSQEEMALYYGLSIDAYKQRKSRALKAIRKRIEQHGKP